MYDAEQQRMEALAIANSIRLERAAIRRKIGAKPLAEGAKMACAVIHRPPACCEGMTLRKLLTAIQRFGPRKVTVLSRTTEVGADRPLRSLNQIERDRLVRALLNGGAR